MSSSGCQMSARPPPKPKVLKPIDSSATLPARIIRSAHEILLPYLLFDGPEQAARFVEVDVVGPAVDRRKTLIAGAATATSVRGAVGAGAVPGHADEQAAVVTPVSGPPILRIGHQLGKVFLDRGQVEFFEFFCVVKIGVHRVGSRRMLVQDVQVQLVGPPVAVRCTSAGSSAASFACDRTLAFFAHFISL